MTQFDPWGREELINTINENLHLYARPLEREIRALLKLLDVNALCCIFSPVLTFHCCDLWVSSDYDDEPTEIVCDNDEGCTIDVPLPFKHIGSFGEPFDQSPVCGVTYGTFVSRHPLELLYYIDSIPEWQNRTMRALSIYDRDQDLGLFMLRLANRIFEREFDAPSRDFGTLTYDETLLLISPYKNDQGYFILPVTSRAA